MKNYLNLVTAAVVVAGVLVAGALHVAGVIDSDTESTAVNLLIGLIAGGSIAAYATRATA